MKATLVHEIQHAIQYIEGFAVGTNSDYAKEAVDSNLAELQKIVEDNKETIKPYNDFASALGDYITWVKALENPDKNVRKSRIYMEYGNWWVSKNKKEAHQQYLDAIEKARPYYREQMANLRKMLTLSQTTFSKGFVPEWMADTELNDISMEDLSKLYKSIKGKISRLYEKMGFWKVYQQYAKMRDISNLSPYEIYANTSGEVEARNAAKRYSENLYRTFPADTEDVARNQQYSIDKYGFLLKQETDTLFQSVVPEDFSKQVDSITEKDIGTKDKTIVFSESTPRVFLSLGLNNLPVEMYVDKLARGLTLENNEAHGHAEGLSKDIVKSVCKNLGNPLAVFNSASVKGRLVALYDIEDLKGDGIIISITPDAKKSNAIEVNLISSIYGKENKSVFKKWIDSGLLRYVDNTNIKSLAFRLQLPSTKTLYTNNVLTKSQLVNNFVTENEDILKQENIIEAETELSEKYKDSFDKAGNKQFASENEESIIKEIVYSYPKHTVANGVQMLDGLLDDNHDMPMQKKYLTARLVKELLGEDLILLPRYMDRMLNRVAGYQRFDNYSLSDGISAVSKDGRTFEFKFVASPKKVVKNLNTALRKADVAVVITSISDSLDRINVSKVIGNGEAYIINVYDEKNIDIRHKNTSTKEWRLVHSDSKSGHGFDNSNRIVSIASELQKVKPEDQTPMDYSIYNREAEERNKAALEALQSQSEENIRAVAVSGDSLKQISDAEWVETAKRIALQAPSLEEFFRLYRQQVENGDAEVSDLDTQMILSNLYRGEHLTDYSEDYYSDYEEDAPSSIDEDDDWTVEGPDDEGTPSSATSSSDSSDMPDEVPDWFFGEDEVAETENSATETEQTIKDMEDAVTEVQKVVVDSDLPKKLSLDHSRSLDTSIKARAVEFSSILSASKEETIKFLQTLKEVNAEFFYNEPRIDSQLVTEEDVADEAVRRTAYDEFDSISKFIQNLIYDSKGAKVSRDLTKLSDRAWKIVAGQVAKNAEVYMDLYARASNNTEWAGDNSIEAKVLTELGITERDWNNASFYRRKMYLQDIADKRLREKISSGQVYDKELREYLARAEEKAEASLAETKAIEESQKYIIEENKKTILKLSTEAKDAVDKISDLQKEQEEVQGKIDRLVIRMEQKLKKQGQSIEKETLDHDELIRRQNALKRREAEYRNALESITYRNVYIEIEIIPHAFSPGLNGKW